MENGIKARQEVEHGGVPLWGYMANALSLSMAKQVAYDA